MRKQILIFSILVMVVMPSLVSATILGVNKVNINFDDVLRNGYAEATITASMDTEKKVNVFYEAQGDIKDWIRFEPEQPIQVSKDSPGQIKIIVEPPADARADTYEGLVVVTTGHLGNQTSAIGSNVVVAFEEKLKVTVTDTQILKCLAAGFEMQDTEIERGIPLIATIRNTGNVRIKPDLQIKVYNQEERDLITELNYTQEEEILPTTSFRLKTELENELEPGQYWARISSNMCDGTSKVTFSVLEKGGISDKGDFIRLSSNPWAETGELVPITASFKNRGERTVSAEFRGIISKDAKIVDVLKSEQVDVPPGETVELEVFYALNEPGQYKVSGRVVYNNKITEEKGSVINVNEGVSTQNSYETLLAIILIGVILIGGVFGFLILRSKIKKKRKIY